MTTTDQQQPVQYRHAEDGSPGAWIGIDLGTSNCCAAVWDATRARPKVLQLHGLARPRKGKTGRVMPSALLLGEGSWQDIGVRVKTLVGHDAVKRMEETGSVKAFVSSVKRLIGESVPTITMTTTTATTPDGAATQNDAFGKDSVPMIGTEFIDGKLTIRVQPLDQDETVNVVPEQVLRLLLESIRQAAEVYLMKNTRKKKLSVPGGSTPVTVGTTQVCNCVVGVPAHFGTQQRALVIEACRQAGFSGHVSTLTESTAASMAYGLFVSVPTTKHVMVLDMGGGTTDVTISRLSKEDNNFVVLATKGDRRLGGDDMDEALLRLILDRASASDGTASSLPYVDDEKRSLMLRCRKAKEALCGTDDDPPSQSVSVEHKDTTITIDQADLEAAIRPLLGRVRELVTSAMSQCDDVPIDEVVLVGGATRVPALQQLLKSVFPDIPDLCMSLDAEAAVAQGTAIQAAIKSGLVPIAGLKSAMMLDALPHTLGVLVPGSETDYIPILAQDSVLPAMGYATFILADPNQAGVTVHAVEDTGDGTLERVGEFSFLLRRLSDDQLKQLGGTRSVDIGFTMEVSGKLIVSIFDENDPEHVRKKQRYQAAKAGNPVDSQGDKDGRSGGSTMNVDNEEVPIGLLVGAVVLFLLYVIAKAAFHQAGESSGSIL